MPKPNRLVMEYPPSNRTTGLSTWGNAGDCDVSGNAPPILASDLVVTEDVALTVEMALQLRWAVVENLLSLGIDIIDQNIVVMTTAATVQVHF